MDEFDLRLSYGTANTESELPELEEERHKAVAAKDSRDHVRAHKLLLTFFPRMPEGACSEILEHGFQKGSGRVGRSGTLEDNIKVQLAVNAHIRHRLTQYDAILAANKGQDAKLAAREVVNGQVQAIADSWRAPSSQAGVSVLRTPVPKDSAAILEANRQRRIRTSKAQTTTASEAQVLEEALNGLRINEKEHEATARMKAAQRRAQKKAEKLAHKTFRHKKRRRDALRLHTEQQEGPGQRIPSQNVHKRQDKNPLKPTKQGGNRKLRIADNGVELEPKEPDTYAPVYEPSDAQLPKPRVLRSDYPTFGKIPKDIHIIGDHVELEPKGHDRYMPTSGLIPSIEKPAKSRYPLRRNRDRYMPTSGPNPSIEHPRQSRDPLRSSHRTIGDLGSNSEGLHPIEQSTNEDGRRAGDSEWMDIDDISVRTAGVHLA